MHSLYNLWSGGLVNRLMSFETAIAMQTLTKTEFLICGDTPMYSAAKYIQKYAIRGGGNIDKTRFTDLHHPRLSDLIDKKSIDNVFFTDGCVESVCKDEIVIEDLFNNYISCDGLDDSNFAEGRKKVVLEEEMNYNFKKTLAWYSATFLSRTTAMDQALERLSFKSEYVDAAKYIASQVGEFDAVHIRRTDHIPLSRQYTFDTQERVQDLDSKNLLILTDEPYGIRYRGKFAFLDSLMLTEFKETLDQIRCTNTTEFDLLNMLIAGYAKRFVGTQGSTYSGYIHRMVDKNSPDTHKWDYFGLSKPVKQKNGSYSWNDIEKMPMIRKVWWLEWPESRLSTGA